ncbi:MAG: triose-phosphate isomerase [Candidatus Woesearchaeota archaeon]
MAIIMINFKTYATSVGIDSALLANICNEVADLTQSDIRICVSPTDIYKVSQQIHIPVYSQHVDGVEFGAHTGKILAIDIKEHGGQGSLINHSEDQYSIEQIRKAVLACRESALTSVVCADSIETVKQVIDFEPDCIAYEPPELIGGDISVTTKPEVIKELVHLVKEQKPNMKILVGAGVKTGKDVALATKLGCHGVLLASGVTKSPDPHGALLNLLSGIQK